MKKSLAVMAVAALLITSLLNAATVTPFSGVTSAKLKGTINAQFYGDNPSCYPGVINVAIGFIDYTIGLDMTVDPLAENAIWQTVVGTLADGALTFDFQALESINGADVNTTLFGDPWEKDITSLFNQVVADGNAGGKAYALCILTRTGPGKINLNANESATSYAQLLGFEVTDANGTHMFKYKKTSVGGDPVNNIYDRIQYTGHRAAHSGNYNDQFAVGGHEGGPGGYETAVEDRGAFFFHRGLAVNLGWVDSVYPNDLAAETVAPSSLSLSLSNMPNPFTGSTRIAYTLDKSASVQLSVYDVTGKLVKNLISGVQKAGAYSVSWNAKAMPMGMYMLRLKAGDRVMNRKLIVTK